MDSGHTQLTADKEDRERVKARDSRRQSTKAQMSPAIGAWLQAAVAQSAPESAECARRREVRPKARCCVASARMPQQTSESKTTRSHSELERVGECAAAHPPTRRERPKTQAAAAGSSDSGDSPAASAPRAITTAGKPPRQSIGRRRVSVCPAKATRRVDAPTNGFRIDNVARPTARLAHAAPLANAPARSSSDTTPHRSRLIMRESTASSRKHEDHRCGRKGRKTPRSTRPA